MVQDSSSLSYVLLPSDFGPLVLLWSETAVGPRVERLLLPMDGQPPEEMARVLRGPGPNRPCVLMDELAQDITRFLEGQDVIFPLEVLSLERCSDFQQQVLRAEHAIPRGWVSTYGHLARHVGNPAGARAVGTALATNPFPILIPCHRVVRGDGTIGGYRGGSAMKRALLDREGVRISPDGKVLTERLYSWRKEPE